MFILAYIPSGGARMERAVCDIVDESDACEIMVLRDMSEFVAHLENPACRDAMAVMLTYSRQQLIALYRCAPLLKGMESVVLLPRGMTEEGGMHLPFAAKVAESLGGLVRMIRKRILGASEEHGPFGL